MMQLMCQVADLRFALPVDDVVEVVGRPTLDPVPAAPAWVAGSFVHRGVITPVVDIAVLAGIGQARLLWSSRVIVVQRNVAQRVHRIGLLFDRSQAEQVPEQQTGQATQASVQIWPWGKSIIDQHGTYCLLDLDTLFSPAQQALIFPGTQ